jgi:hypothetical protein
MQRLNRSRPRQDHLRIVKKRGEVEEKLPPFAIPAFPVPGPKVEGFNGFERSAGLMNRMRAHGAVEEIAGQTSPYIAEGKALARDMMPWCRNGFREGKLIDFPVGAHFQLTDWVKYSSYQGIPLPKMGVSTDGEALIRPRYFFINRLQGCCFPLHQNPPETLRL